MTVTPLTSRRVGRVKNLKSPPVDSRSGRWGSAGFAHFGLVAPVRSIALTNQSHTLQDSTAKRPEARSRHQCLAK